MFFSWLKSYMPRSLYGRAALILVLPVVVLQLVVSVVFIQRHFEGVTQQMTQSTSREIGLILQAINDGREPVTGGVLATGLSVKLQPVAPGTAIGNQRRWYDFSGRIVLRELREVIPGLIALQLPDDSDVKVFVQTTQGPVEMMFDRRRVSASNPHQLFVHMVGFGALMTIIAFIYLRNQLRPIKRLARAAEAFGRGRHVNYRPSGALEVRAAGSAFIDMRNRIERQIEQRTLMLSGVSHDLRTPLTRLRLGLSLLEDDERKPLEQDVDEMQRMMDEFLSFARDASEGEAEPTDPIELVQKIVEDCQRADIAVVLGDMEGQGEVELRRVAFRRAIENLINNAVRYGTHAVVSVVLTDRSLRIRVEDDGPGIPAEQREEALRPFTRLDAARNQNRGSGVGLGLSIATDVARAHGGVLRLGDSATLGGLRADIVIAR
ncbi:MAG: two-component sensor histidine kinase [Rhodobacterales bacterium]|nr:MAG: two-component sensor histidine kinase [Rhodobacterales bacterium]